MHVLHSTEQSKNYNGSFCADLRHGGKYTKYLQVLRSTVRNKNKMDLCALTFVLCDAKTRLMRRCIPNRTVQGVVTLCKCTLQETSVSFMTPSKPYPTEIEISVDSVVSVPYTQLLSVL